MEVVEIAKKYVIKHQKKRGRYIVFEVPDKGLWRIKANKKTKKEADDWVKAHTPKKKRK